MRKNRDIPRLTRPARFLFHQRPLREARGGALIFTVLLLSLVMLILVGALAGVAVFQTRDRARYEVYKDEFAAAEESVNKVYAHIHFLVRNGIPNLTTLIPATPQPIVAGYEITDFSVRLISQQMETEDDGSYPQYVQRYTAGVRATKEGNKRFPSLGVKLSQDFNISYTPLNLFAIFYDPILEIAPGAAMTVTGKVHSNSDMYLMSDGGGLQIRDSVTVAGNAYHGRHPDSGRANNDTPDVSITNGSTQVSMKRSSGDSNGDGWLDSRDTDWSTAADTRWNQTDSYFKTQAHGVVPMDLPIPTVADPHSIIERALPPSDPCYSPAVETEKLENKAGMRIIADAAGTVTAKDDLGNTVYLDYYKNSAGKTYSLAPGATPPSPYTKRSVVSTATFYDAREGGNVTSIDVNVANLKDYSSNLDLSEPANRSPLPANGLLYVSNEDRAGSKGVVRLTNGSQLPVAAGATGFSVGSDDPVYVKGDYNTVNKTLALVAGDAVDILSNAWNDANSADYSKRTASNTTTNAVFINGIVPSGDSHYSGGVENYFRYLENWSGKNHTFGGSIIELYESAKGLGQWVYGSPVYTAPQRTWSWDATLGGVDSPPGTPRVVTIQRAKWEIGS